MSSDPYPPKSEPVEAEPPRYDALELTRSTGLARIALEGQVYTLRITRQRKLILTK